MNEVNLNINVSVSKNGATNGAAAGLVLDMDGDNVISNIQTVGTTAEVVQTGDVAFPCGYVFIKNLAALPEDEETPNILTITEATNDRILSVLGPQEFALLKGLDAAPEAAFDEAAGIAQFLIMEA